MSASDLSLAVWEVETAEFPADEPLEARVRYLLRFAILAPSSHNSQPWSFAIDGGTVHIHADESRWLEIADRDRRELYVSLGCALENLLIAASRFGFDVDVEYGDGGTGPIASVTLSPDAEAEQSPGGETDRDRDAESDRRRERDRDSALFEAITDRRTSHAAFADRPLPAEAVERFRALARDSGVDLLLVDDARKSRLAELQLRADERLMADPGYRRELGHWIGIGALGASWLAARIGQAAVTYLDIGHREGKKNSTLVERSPAVAVLTTAGDALEDRIRTGQVFERIALAATLEGIATHPMSQILERPGTKAELAALLDLGESTPQHLFRLGYVEGERAGDRTPRWPLSTVTR